jgi:DNA segregation ATPase FtsK/SpoIIIE, S-DNA-T family
MTFTLYLGRALRESGLWLLMCAGLYLLVALVSYAPQDPGWSYTGPSSAQVHNAGGPVGAWLADVLLYLCGYFAFLFPVMVGWSAVLVFRPGVVALSEHIHILPLRWLGFVVTLAAGAALADLYIHDPIMALPAGTGGVLGQMLAQSLVGALKPLGSALLLVATFLSGFTLFSGLSWLTIMDRVGGWTLGLAGLLYAPALLGYRGLQWLRTRRAEPVIEVYVASPEAEEPVKQAPSDLARPVKRKKPEVRAQLARVEPRMPEIKVGRPDEVENDQLPLPLLPEDAVGELPPLALLDLPRPSGKGCSDEALQTLCRLVEAKLADFGVTVQVVAVHPGPVVTLFELQLAPGTKVSKISGLAKDLARALSVVSVRVVEVIPGKPVIGLEVPNEEREIVVLSEVLRSQTYENAKSVLTLGLGKDIAGNPVVADLGKMPHALIAGTTGSGKSVAINAMILSLLYKAKPSEVRLIMIDPKMLELSVYQGIPHLLTPVVTDMKDAANALRWCVGEMEQRYKLMSALGVRNIKGYNKKVADAEAAGVPIPDPLFVPEQEFLAEGEDPPRLQHLPYIVVIIDELADMMMVVGKKVEELIARLAQKARASGIHLLLATQRPSVDVLTGLIKANIPTRIAFQVSSRIDSRTVLDQMGAEHLLGHGDMLYLAPGNSIPQRVHGAFVDDHEVHKVAEHLKTQGVPDYVDTVLLEPTEHLPGIDAEPRGDPEDTDPLFDEAVRIVTESRRASISGVQRRLKIGYNRAARLIEEMERIGVVGPQEPNGNREVLVAAPPESDD